MKVFRVFKYYFSTGGYMLKLEFQGQMEYPAFLVGWFLSNALQFAVGISMLKVITVQFQTINGWTFEQIAFLYGLAIISHALAVILFIQTWALQYLVRNGQFDRMLLRPMDVYFQFCVCKLNLIGLSDMLPGLVIFIYGAAATGFSFNFANIVKIIAVCVGAVMIRGGIYTMFGSVAFFTKSSSGLIDVINNLFDKANMYPMSIYGTFVQGLLTFVLPIGFISYYPASSFLGKETTFMIPGIVPLWALAAGGIMLMTGMVVFRLGLWHYDSSGT